MRVRGGGGVYDFIKWYYIHKGGYSVKITKISKKGGGVEIPGGGGVRRGVKNMKKRVIFPQSTVNPI
jgi:hypothetical protein